LAAKLRPDEVKFDEVVRAFIFDESAHFPEDIYIYYWIYPFEGQIILRDFVMPSVRGHFSNQGFFQLMKYFPVAYLITDLSNYEDLPELTKYRNYSSDEEAEVKIYLNKIYAAGWPEKPDPGNFLVFGQGGSDSIYAKPRKSN